MPPMSAPERDVSARRARAVGALALAVSLSCAPQDGVVGAVARDADADPNGPVFATEFEADEGAWATRVELSGGAVTFGQEDPDTVDGWLARLEFPGDATAEASSHVGPDYVTELRTAERFGFGTYRTRVRFGSCEPHEEVVAAILGYLNDGSDADGDSITDNTEIDLQLLCGTPTLLYLTVFTDYALDGLGVERFQKLTRVIDFATGDYFDTPAADRDELTLTGRDDRLRRPDFPSPETFYEVGYEWHPASLRFFLDLNGEELTLWTLEEPATIPQRPVHFMYNLWHPATHWAPTSGSADFPAAPVTLEIDWLRIWGE